MGGKKKGQNKPQPASNNVVVPEPSEPIDRFQKLNDIVEQLKSFSPKKEQPSNVPSSPVASSTVKQNAKPTTEKAENLNDGEGKSRVDIENERKAKKLEKQMKKEAATAKKKAEKAPGIAPQQSKPASNETSGNKKSPKAAKNAKEPKSALKTSPAQDSTSHDASRSSNRGLNVSFKDKNIQPANQTPTEHHVIRTSADFIHATPYNVHPGFRRLAAKCENSKLNGVNELLLAFHRTLIQFVDEYTPRPDLPFSESISLDLQPQLCCLSDNGVHPFPQAVGNLIRLFKKQIHELDQHAYDATECKTCLKEWLENSAYYNFELAEKAIVDFTISKLQSMTHRRILTYSRCPVVEKIILTAAEKFTDLHIYIVDDPINGNQGKAMLESLSEMSIPCTYGHINSIGYLVQQASVVLLGCSAILNTGRVVALRGSSLLALSAQAVNIPVLVAAKTCTFVDKVRLDEHLSTALLREPIETIPEDLVTALVTDLRIVPPSSAPAVLKAKQLGYDN